MKKLLGKLPFLLSAISIAHALAADPSVVFEGDALKSPEIPVSDTDLINEEAPTLGSLEFSGEGLFDSDGQQGAINDGLNPLSMSTKGGANFAPSVGSTFTFTLEGSPTGYDIERVETFTAFRAVGRVAQAYKLEFSYVGDSAFSEIVSLDEGNASMRNTGKVVITDPDGSLGTGVDQIRFTIALPSRSGLESVYGEFDVFGTASEPPSAEAESAEAEPGEAKSGEAKTGEAKPQQ